MKEATNQRAFLFGGLFACPCDLVRAETSRVGQATAARWLRLYRSHVSHCFIDCTHIDLNPALSGQIGLLALLQREIIRTTVARHDWQSLPPFLTFSMTICSQKWVATKSKSLAASHRPRPA